MMECCVVDVATAVKLQAVNHTVSPPPIDEHLAVTSLVLCDDVTAATEGDAG